jgi:glycosyltransferase involved in cell wall biosynthesis
MTTFILPGDVDDVTRPSGGNTYDRRMCEALGADVRAVRGTWPTPDNAARSELARVLAALPDGASVLLDGLVAGGVPEVIVPQARRLRLAVLVHLPLADETGLDAAPAADLDGRERETLRAVGAVVATSPWAARRLIEHHGLAADRVHAVPPGVDPAPLASETDAGSRLLCVASLTARKGQDLLAEALAAVADLAWTCECVGPVGRDTAHVERLRGLIERHGLADRMSLAGPRTGERLAATYAAADLVVLPSHAETYGMVLTEALARGIPVLATAVDAVPETVGHAPDGSVPGILVSPGDVPALAEALRRYLTEPDLRHRLRVSARQRRRMLTGWDTTARRLAGVLPREPSCTA